LSLVTGPCADLGQLVCKSVLGDAVVGEDALDGRGLVSEYAYHHVLHGQVFVAHALGGLFRRLQHSVRLRGKIHLGGSAASHLGEIGYRGVQLRQDGVAVHAHLAE
jgi:hypothetical protein